MSENSKHSKKISVVDVLDGFKMVYRSKTEAAQILKCKRETITKYCLNGQLFRGRFLLKEIF